MKEKAILRAKEIEEEVKNYDPHNNRSATGDAFKTLFVARIVSVLHATVMWFHEKSNLHYAEFLVQCKTYDFC